MRLERRNVVLGALLLVLVSVQLLGRDEGVTVRGGPGLLERFAPSQVTRVVLTRGEERCDLVRVDGDWRVRQRADFAAQAERVDELLLRLASLGPADLVSEERSSYARYGIDADAVSIELRGAEDEVLATLRAGRPEDAATGSHLARAGGEGVYRASAIPLPEPLPERWLELKLIDLAIPEVRLCRVQRAGGEEHELVLQSDGRWNLRGTDRYLTQRVVQDLLLVASTTFCEDVSETPLAEAGLSEPSLVCTLVAGEAEARTLSIGGSVDGLRALRRSDWRGPWVALVRPRSAANLEGALLRVLAAIEG